VLAGEGKLKEAQQQVREFLKYLCKIRVLDPACGSGNFLYVTLEHLKRLEGEILNQLDELGDTQGRLDLQGVSVDPHQLLGIELNPRAAEIAEMVLWIGYLQWHFRTRGQVMPPQPVLKDFHNIECRDAVLAYDRMEYVTDERGVPVTRWDGKTTKKHPVTGEDVPDETARMVVEKYVNPRKAEWPQADFVIGNPPFIGAASMRAALGDGYTESLRKTWPEVPESADFVMHWWDRAAELTRAGKLRRFGLITTNSLRQTFSRRVLERHLGGKPPLSLAFAIPDHPWVDSADGAAVRIAMTVGTLQTGAGALLTSAAETPGGDGAIDVTLVAKRGVIHADLTTGANVAAAGPLQSNGSLTSRGMMLFGAGFIVTRDEAATIGLGRNKDMAGYIREYRNGRDLTDRSRDVLVIDLFGLSVDEVRARFPEIYQWVLERVKPERDQNRDAAISRNWWLHGRPRPELRVYLRNLARYIATVETAKHRTFQFLDASILPDNKLVVIGSDDSFHLGVLSSSIHVTWALRAGGWLGIGNDPVYVKSRCFDPFPFPTADEVEKQRIRNIAEDLDAHRKRVLAEHPHLTLTGLYNVLERLRAGVVPDALDVAERRIFDDGLVLILNELHDKLDAAVADAYDWPSNLADQEILARLVALNKVRAKEEAKGRVLWLRPDYQVLRFGSVKEKAELDLVGGEMRQEAAIAIGPKSAFPSDDMAQTASVMSALAMASGPLDAATIASSFTQGRRVVAKVAAVLTALARMGFVDTIDGGRSYRLRRVA
jgi:hypothetical protein